MTWWVTTRAIARKYIENDVCICGLTRYAHRRRYDKEPGGTHYNGGCEKFTVPGTKYHDEHIRILAKPVVVGAVLGDETVEQDATSIRFSLLELE